MLTNEEIQLLASETTRQFILTHENDDPYELSLRKGNICGLSPQRIAEQIIARKKIRFKVPQWLDTEGLVLPPPLSAEQASSAATAAYKAGLVSPGATMADLTGGAGVDSSFFAERCRHVDYVEKQEDLCRLAEHNFRVLGLDHIKVSCAPLEQYLVQWVHQPTAYVYLDPARRDAVKKKVFLVEDCEPNLADVLPQLLAAGAKVMVKLSPLFDLHALHKQFEGLLGQVHVVSVRNECKELLAFFEERAIDCKVSCVNLETTQPAVSLAYSELREKPVIVYNDPEKYLYEPNASLMKAGCYDHVAQNFGLKKLHPHTHLFTGSVLNADYPGRVFQVIGIYAVDKQELSKAMINRKANIASRNFPASPEGLYTRLGFKSGGNDYLFAVTLASKKKCLIHCIKA